ncbi:trypsin-like peptidase domain-containing protein [Lentzea sp. HUAS TT2]|uniref:trypsin-like peptidase domain-containing protein n=1 Tax=Lentzea sp. HUAS TT2 TaxID=3447454 RepID=UPI003F70CAEC
MAHKDFTGNETGDVHGIGFQIRNVHGDVYLQQTPASAKPVECDPPALWAETIELPVEITHLPWAQEQASDLQPYQQLRGARTPSLRAVCVRQGLGGVVETQYDQGKPTLLSNEHGRLVEFPVVPSVRVTVQPPPKPMRSAVDADPHLIVVGGPGQGKSTLTLRLTAEICRNWKLKSDDDTAPLTEPVIPLRITARTLAQHLGSSFTQALADSAFAEYGRYMNGLVDAALFAGRVAGCRWLLLVDALDEVADSALRATLVHTIQARASLPDCRVLLTARPTEGGVLAALQRAGSARYETQPFDIAGLERFARKWPEEVKGDHADRFLRQTHEAHLDELVEVSLLATIAAIVFAQHQDRPLPGNQFEPYENYLDYIRGDRSATGPFDRYRVPLIEHLGRTRLSTDSSLALAVHEQTRLRDIAPVDTLIAYLVGAGQFIQRGNDIVFTHHSLAEYVAATPIVRDLPDKFAPEHHDFGELLHTALPAEGGRFARPVLLRYAHTTAAMTVDTTELMVGALLVLPPVLPAARPLRLSGYLSQASLLHRCLVYACNRGNLSNDTFRDLHATGTADCGCRTRFHRADKISKRIGCEGHMETAISRATLVRELANLYPDDESVQRLLSFAEIPMSMVRFSSRPIDTWHSALTETGHRNKLVELLQVVLLEQPENAVLHGGLRDSLTLPSGSSTLSLAVGNVEKIMGSQSTLLPVSFLETGLQVARSVGRISTPGGSLGTGFLISNDILVTNNHVLPTFHESRDAEVRFNYQADSSGTICEYVTLPLCPADGFETSLESDLTLVKMPQGTNSAWGAISAIEFDTFATKRVNIVQHPGGGPKQIALYHNIVSHIDDTIIQYYTDTLPGSSGSPLLDDQWRLVGVHHAGGQLYSPSEKKWVYRNEGIALNKLLELIQRFPRGNY